MAIAVKLIDAQFPPYEQVIPKEHKKTITVDRLRLIAAPRPADVVRDPRRQARGEQGRRDDHERQPRPREVREEFEAEYNSDAIAIADLARSARSSRPSTTRTRSPSGSIPSTWSIRPLTGPKRTGRCRAAISRVDASGATAICSELWKGIKSERGAFAQGDGL
jgi:hypothetical protein